MTDYSKFKLADSFKQLDPLMWQTEDTPTGFPSIRFRGKTWTLNYNGKSYPFLRADDSTAQSYIDIIVVAINKVKSRVYFGPQAWDENSAGSPICASMMGVVPDPGVPEPQSPTCGLCSHSEWITKPTGGRGQECQEHFRAAVLLHPTMTAKMLPAPLQEPVFFKIPPGSFKSWERYKNEMISQGFPLAAVVTRVSFSPPPKTFEMTFELFQTLSDAEYPRILELMRDQQTKTIIGTTPEIREIAPPKSPRLSELPREEHQSHLGEVIETVRKRPGRPKAVPAPVPTPVIHAMPEPIQEPVGEPVEDSGETYEESDTDLDDSIIKLMGKMSKMMPK